MKEGDLILVSAEATGLGKPMEAVIDKIETFMGQTLVTVTYTQPDALSGFGGCFADSHITPQNSIMSSALDKLNTFIERFRHDYTIGK